MSNNRMAVRLNLPTLVGALALASVSGCDDAANLDADERAQVDSRDIDASVDPIAADGADAGLDAGTDADAGGPAPGIDGGLTYQHIEAVVANGSGCPAGSFTTAIAPDGLSATVNLSQFELEVSQQSTLALKDCQLGIQVTAEEGRQYQIGRASAQGVVYLEEGVQARVQINRYFQGNPAAGDEWRTDLRGPLDQELQADTSVLSDQWSPCGLKRDVNVRFTARLTNGTGQDRNGLVNIDQAMVFSLDSRPCQD
ncbi:MAG: DUF4360 domain-containing protein [Polyangiales bacterium]